MGGALCPEARLREKSMLGPVTADSESFGRRPAVRRNPAPSGRSAPAAPCAARPASTVCSTAPERPGERRLPVFLPVGRRAGHCALVRMATAGGSAESSEQKSSVIPRDFCPALGVQRRPSEIGSAPIISGWCNRGKTVNLRWRKSPNSRNGRSGPLRGLRRPAKEKGRHGPHGRGSAGCVRDRAGESSGRRRSFRLGADGTEPPEQSRARNRPRGGAGRWTGGPGLPAHRSARPVYPLHPVETANSAVNGAVNGACHSSASGGRPRSRGTRRGTVLSVPPAGRTVVRPVPGRTTAQG